MLFGARKKKRHLEKKAYNPEPKEALENLVDIKRAINLTKKALEDPTLNAGERKQHEERLSRYWRLFEAAQEAMFDLDRGLYFGLGFDLAEPNTEGQKLVPVYSGWKPGHGHYGIQGSTRVGKTVLLQMLVRQIIRKRESLIMVDPKGGFGQEVVATILEELALTDQIQDFMYISPAFVNLSDRINVLYGLSNEAIASMVAKLTETPTSEQFFSDVVYKVVLAVTTAFEAFESYDDPTGEITRGFVAHEIRKWNSFVKSKGMTREVVDAERHISMPDQVAIEKDFDALYNPTSPTEGDLRYTRTLMTFRDLAKFATYEALQELRENLHSLDAATPDLAGVDKATIDGMEHKRQEAVRLLDDVLAQQKEFFTKISVSLSTILTQLSAGNTGHVFCDIRINPLFLRLQHSERKTFAVIQPFPLMFKTVSMMSVKVFMSMLESIMGTVGASGRSLNERIHFVIDEAASVVFNGIETLFNQAGGLGVTLYVATQSFSDWSLKLGEANARVVMDNINNIIRLRMNDISSCEQVTKEFGIKKKMITSAMFSEHDTRYMTDVKDEWIVPPEMVMRLPVARAFAKFEQNIYLLDLPYYSGPKGFLSMPELDIERLRTEMNRMDMQLQRVSDAFSHQSFVELQREMETVNTNGEKR